MKPDATPKPAAACLMRWLAPLLTALLSACGLILGETPAEAAETQPRAAARTEQWVLVASRPLQGSATPTPNWAVGSRWTLRPATLTGPAPLRCEKARQQLLVTPPQGLFQGAWQAETEPSAAARATALGLPAQGAATLRLDCANASFDFHRDARGQLLTALDGQVLVLRVEPGADDAQAAVRQLLLQHLASPQGFGPDSPAQLQAWLDPALREAFKRWLARPERPDEVPALDGDPFSDTQEPPRALSLGPISQRGDSAEQVVHAELEGGRRHRLVYQLRRDAQTRQWQLQDIAYSHGPTLLQLLRSDSR